MQRLQGLQQLRFFAAFLVLIHHTLEECSVDSRFDLSDWIVTLGACGVDIFFIISGFVIWKSTKGLQTPPATEFIKKRALRVMPIYWLFLGIMLALWATKTAFRSIEVNESTLIASILLIPPPTKDGLIMGVAWTLVYEIYFYLICAIALCARLKKARPILVALLLFFAPSLLSLVGFTRQADYYSNPLVIEFLFGCIVAQIYSNFAIVKFRYIAALSGIFGLAISSWAFGSSSTGGLPNDVRWWAWGLPATFLVLSCVIGIKIPKRYGGEHFAFLGNASYVLYLTRGFVMIALARVLKSGIFDADWSTTVLGLASIGIAISLSYGIHKWIEIPITEKLNFSSKIS